VSPPERIRRPDLDRAQPDRSWSTMLGRGPGAAAERGNASDGSASGEDDVVRRAVHLGYRVVDEYVRLGEEAATRLGRRDGEAGGHAEDVRDLALRFTRYAAEAMGAWIELWEVARDGEGGTRDAPGDGAASPAPAAGADWVPVSVAVTTARPAEVHVDLRPGTGAPPLGVSPLRATADDAPWAGTLAVAREVDGRVRLVVRVADDQVAGTFHGVVIDEDRNLPVGFVSVIVGGGDATSQR
jgi:hypothetical protein